MRPLKALRNFGKVALMGDPGGAVQCFTSTVRRKRKLLTLRLNGHTVYIRSCSPDLDVALSCLGGEFDEVIRSVPVLENGLIVDAGGYIGTAAIVFAKAYPSATVITIEPSADNFRVLKKNVAPYPNITPIRAAVAASRGTIELRDRGTGAWGFTIVEGADGSNGNVIEKVDCLTLQDIVGQTERSAIDILKIDIEGGEKKLLSGDTSWVGFTKAICIELHDRVVSGCTQAFEEATAGRINTKLEGEKYLSLAA